MINIINKVLIVCWEIITNAVIPIVIVFLTLYITRKDENKKKESNLKISIKLLYDEILGIINYMEEILINEEYVKEYHFTNIDFKEIIYDFNNLKKIGFIKSDSLYNITLEEVTSLISLMKKLEEIKKYELPNYETNDTYLKFDRSLRHSFISGDNNLEAKEKDYIKSIEKSYNAVEEIFNKNSVSNILNLFREFINSDKYIKLKGIEDVRNERDSIIKNRINDIIEQLEKIKKIYPDISKENSEEVYDAEAEYHSMKNAIEENENYSDEDYLKDENYRNFTYIDLVQQLYHNKKKLL